MHSVLLVCFALAAADRPNVLLVVADDLGYSDLGCYGGEIDTPHLDALAAGGLRLTQFYATPRCCPSRATLMTGRPSHAVGLGHMTQDIGRPGYRGRLDPDAVTLAERLAGVGYRRFLAGKWHLGTPDPTRHGFEAFYGTLVSAKTFWDADHMTAIAASRPPTQPFYATDAVADAAIGFLDAAAQTPERPWFLYLAMNAPHFPLHAPPETIAKYADRYRDGWDAVRAARLERMIAAGLLDASTALSPRSPHYDWASDDPQPTPAWNALPEPRRRDLARRMAIYAAMVDRLDAAIGRVFEHVRASGDWNDTLVVFTSDNGACAEWDPFGFDGESGPSNVLHTGEQLDRMGQPGTFHSVGSGWANASNTPWRMFKHYTHEGGIAVPLILRVPGGHEPGVRRTPAHLIDIAPTVLEAAGVAADDSLPGRSLLPLTGGDDLGERMLFFEHEGHRAVRDGSWKLVALRGGPWALYDLAGDRIESRDLAATRPDRVASMAAAWDEWAAANRVTPLPDDYEVEYLPAAE